MKTSEAIRVVFRLFGHLFRCMLSKKPVLIDVSFLPIITITNCIMFIASSSEYEGASIWKIFGRHKAQNLNQSNLLLVQIFGKLNSGAKGSGDINCIDSSRSIYGCQGNCYYCVHTLKIKLAHSGSKQMRKSP